MKVDPCLDVSDASLSWLPFVFSPRRRLRAPTTTARRRRAPRPSLHGIEVAGDQGKAPEVTWDGKLDVDKIETTVVTEGDGDEIAEGDQVVANIWIGNGYTQEESYNTYDEGGTAGDDHGERRPEPGLQGRGDRPDDRLPRRCHRDRCGCLRRGRQPPARRSATRTRC